MSADTDIEHDAGRSQVRRTSDSPIADPWRDQLLTLSMQLPLDASFEEIGSTFLDHVALLLPHLAVGICLVSDPARAPMVARRLPLTLNQPSDPDPSRLFPRLGEERVIGVDDGGGGSTLHVAAPPGASLRPLDLQIAERAGLVLGAALRRALAYQNTQRSARELERLQAHIIQAEKLASLGQIVAGVVHELNNPLTSIIAYSDYLTRKAQGRLPDESAADDIERLRRIGDAAARILKFSRDLVAYARPSTEVPGPLSLSEVIDKAVVFCEHEFAVWEIRLEREVPADLPVVRGVTGQLTQIFVNLFTNAAHAMSGGGTLRVRVRENLGENSLSVDIEDSGAGIEARDLPHIFEPFFTTKVDGRGTGLGLSIVRDIIDGHGGTVAVRSMVGSGTVFTLTLPLAARPESLLPAPPR
jgi:two-component system, NtrC family, sensor kinase